MSKQHTYRATVEWTGNLGNGTSSYTAYSRDYTVQIAGKPDLFGSSDPAFRGDEHRHNPEDMLLAAVSACHKLWYLHLCSAAGITVTAYTDRAEVRRSGIYARRHVEGNNDAKPTIGKTYRLFRYT